MLAWININYSVYSQHYFLCWPVEIGFDIDHTFICLFLRTYGHLNIKPSVGGVFTGHPNSSLVFFSPFCVDRSSVFSVLLVDHCLSCSCLLVYCLSFNLWLLITPLVSSDYPFGIFWLPLWYLLITLLVFSNYPFGIFWLPLWYLLITPLVSSDYLFDIFWLPLWYLLITPLVSSDYPFGIFKPFLCQHKENSTWIEILTEQSIIHIKAGKKCIWK
jgi:hypothetical protein